MTQVLKVISGDADVAVKVEAVGSILTPYLAKDMEDSQKIKVMENLVTEIMKPATTKLSARINGMPTDKDWTVSEIADLLNEAELIKDHKGLKAILDALIETSGKTLNPAQKKVMLGKVLPELTKDDQDIKAAAAKVVIYDSVNWKAQYIDMVVMAYRENMLFKRLNALLDKVSDTVRDDNTDVKGLRAVMLSMIQGDAEMTDFVKGIRLPDEDNLTPDASKNITLELRRKAKSLTDEDAKRFYGEAFHRDALEKTLRRAHGAHSVVSDEKVAKLLASRPKLGREPSSVEAYAGIGLLTIVIMSAVLINLFLRAYGMNEVAEKISQMFTPDKISFAYDKAVLAMVSVAGLVGMIRTAPASCIVGLNFSVSADADIIWTVKDTLLGRNVRVVYVNNRDDLEKKAEAEGLPGVLIDVDRSEDIDKATIISAVNAAIEQSKLFSDMKAQLKYERIMFRITARSGKMEVAALLTILEELKGKMDAIARYSIEELSSDQLKILADKRGDTLAKVRALRAKIGANQNLNTPMADINIADKKFAAATSENVLISDISGIDNMNQASTGITNYIIFGSIFTAPEQVKAYLRNAGYSDDAIDKIRLIDKRGLSYADIVRSIAAETGVAENNVGIRAAQADNILGDKEKVSSGRYLEVPTIVIDKREIIASFNSYQRMIQVLIGLSGEGEIAAGDTKIPDVYYDSIRGILRLKPTVPVNFAEVFRAYTDAMEALNTAA